jgi:hypothetical protein
VREDLLLLLLLPSGFVAVAVAVAGGFENLPNEDL